MPETGRYYTMSARRGSGDRSWTRYVWLVVECNGSHVVIQNPFAESDIDFGFAPRVVAIDDFDWTPAEAMAMALSPRSRPLQ